VSRDRGACDAESGCYVLLAGERVRRDKVENRLFLCSKVVHCFIDPFRG
jgi:hypothetical protein